MVSTNMSLGLPDGIRGCPFDLDGVLTKTAAVHDAAWKEMFDGYLGERARQTGQAPSEAAVFEDALAGVAAGRAGQFGYVVGVDRVGQAAALKSHGADIVVTDLSDLLDQA